jgi:sugar lactone lactonase YvrE
VYVPSYIGRSIQVYRANADGTLSHAGAIKGDRTNLTEPDYIAIAPDGKIYVNDHERTIYVYAKGTMGNFPPVATIRVRGVQGSLGPIAVDANLLYIAYADELSRIVALNRLRSGLVRPARTIVGASTQLDFPYAVAVGKDGRLFVANARSQQITIYTKNANGNAPPAGHLSGPSTGLGNPYPTSIALDGRGHLIVGVGDLVRVFSENARGNTRPLLSQTVVQDLPFVSGVSADAEGRLYAVSYPTLSVFSPPVGGKLHLLARTSDSHTHIERPQGLTVDPLGRIYVANASGEVNVFPINAVGNIAPVASIGGKEVRIVPGSSMAADSNAALYLPTSAGDSVVVYTVDASHAIRIRVLQGDLTQLQGGHGVAVDRAGKLYVANENGNSITAYEHGASGNSAPTGKIQGEHTGLDHPIGIAISSDGSIVVNNAMRSLDLLDLILVRHNSVVVYPRGVSGDVPPKETLLYKPLCAPEFLPVQDRM